MLKPVLAENLGQLAFDSLERAILSGGIEPGEKLNEANLARQLGISRGPLREALGRLEGLGLVTRAANQRPRVTSLSKDQLIELLVLREAVEGMAARYAAMNATPQEITRLKKLLDSHQEDPMVKAGIGYFQGSGDLDFHIQVAGASKNSRLKDFLTSPIYSVLRLYRRRLSAFPGRASEALAEHRAILDAIECGQPDEAEARMRAHIRASREIVHDHMPASD